jgi:hypothetical protein
MNTLTPAAKSTLEMAILRDLRIGPSSADSTAGRLKTDLRTTEGLLAGLLTDGLVETSMIALTITVYRITPNGLIALS